MRTIKSSIRGSVLILALWTLSLLTVFAVYIGLSIRQRVALLSRIETKSQLHYIGTSGVKKAIAFLRLNQQRNRVLTGYSKYYLYNNPDKFSEIDLGGGVCNVAYQYFDDQQNVYRVKYGVVDEERKININLADKNVLTRLFTNVLNLPEQQALGMAEAIVDWRQYGEHQLTGFYSDDYYSNLPYPYKPKDAMFEIMEELLLVKDFNEEVYNKIRSFITIYGDGRVNINTAPREVLLALGLDDVIVGKILLVRRGFDNLEDTVDDFIFLKPFDIASDLKKFVELNKDETKEIDDINNLGIIKTDSTAFLIESTGQLKNRTFKVSGIYDLHEMRVIYWSEK